MKRLATEIYQAVALGKLNEPFSPAEVRHAVPGWANHTYGTFLPKHQVGNGKTTELFQAVGPGRYKTLPSLQTRY